MRLDVTPVLRSAAFADTIDVIRNTATVDDHGRNVITPKTIEGVSAVVTRAGGNILRREIAGEHIEGSISVYTHFRLTDGRDATHRDLSADIVVYDGNQYTVTVVKDYSRWGEGYVNATCELLPLEPANGHHY